MLCQAVHSQSQRRYFLDDSLNATDATSDGSYAADLDIGDSRTLKSSSPTMLWLLWLDSGERLADIGYQDVIDVPMKKPLEPQTITDLLIFFTLASSTAHDHIKAQSLSSGTQIDLFESLSLPSHRHEGQAGEASASTCAM